MLDAITKPNWDRIKLDFEAGGIPVRELARREGLSDTAIHKRAKSEGWDTGLRAGANLDAPLLQTNQQTTPKTKPDAGEKWEWSPENEDVIIPRTPAIGVYNNAWGHVVIRQEMWPDDDQIIMVRPNDVPELIAALREYAATGSRGPSDA